MAVGSPGVDATQMTLTSRDAKASADPQVVIEATDVEGVAGACR